MGARPFNPGAGASGGGGGSSSPAKLGEYLSVWGDSRTAQNWTTSVNPTVPGPLSRSWAWWSEALSGRVRMTHRYNFGVSGDSTAQLLARMTGDVANGAGVKPSEVPAGPAVLFIGTNSVNAGVSVADLMTQLNACIDWLQGKGHMVFVVAEWPRGTGTTEGSNGLLSAANQKTLYAYASEIRRLNVTKKGVHVVDPWPWLADPTSSKASVIPKAYNVDGLHNAPGNAFIVGELLAKAYEKAGLPKQVFPVGSQDLWDVTNPYGCQNKNPMLTLGAGGNKSTNADPASVVPENYTLTATTGLTVLGSFVTVTMPDGSKRPAYRMVVSGIADGAVNNPNMMLRQSSMYDAEKQKVGDILEAGYEVIVADGHKNLSSVGISLTNGVTANTAYGGLQLTGDQTMPESCVKGFYATPRTNEFTVTSAAQLNFELRFYCSEAGAQTNVTVDILGAWVRKKQ
ncbi:GDSL-like lipase [Pseudomonas phage nickie]|uniref:GDSL-like lipase n=1 Tax=Pseudomonas phage nickie TaxID=2048977 RepID=A0A2H4P733_9CAUD|nr:lipase [Pseudomonas phage nickie]ATW57975.1 GDSL-like lipase [Pseudomonas phage nickie]